MMPSFQRAMPGLHPVPLSASVMYFPPLIKDIICWAGFRQVSKHTFIKALHEKVRLYTALGVAINSIYKTLVVM